MDQNKPVITNPVKVLEVIRQGQIGGGESHLIDLINGFNPTQIEAIVLAFTPGPMIDTLRQKGIKCYVVETSHPFDIRVSKAIRDIIRQEQIQITHAHGSRAASNVVLIARQCHIPLIYTVHGWSFHQDQSSLIYRLRALSEKVICKFSSKVICVSENNKETGEKTFGLKNCTVIENGIDLHKFNPDLPFKNIREELGFSQEDFIIGFIARQTLQKAPLDFVKSTIIAHGQNPRIKALMVGDGDMKNEVEEYIHSERAEDYIRTTSYRQDVPDLLNAIDVFCIPSLWEGLSIALLEAMAMRKALVVTPTDGTRDLISPEITGKIAPFSAPEKLADQYMDYFNHPGQIAQFGNACRQRVEQRFDSQRVSDKVTGIYQTFVRK